MATGTAVESSVPEEPVELPPEEELPPDDAPDDAQIATEARAREMGWKPLAEYRGPPGRWQPAADFIARGENILPIVRDQNRRLTERMGKLEGEVTGLRSTAQEQLQIIKDLREMGQRANKAGYDRAMAEINSQKAQARAAGDVSGGGEGTKAMLIHCGNEGDPDNSGGGGLKPHRRVENLGKDFVVHDGRGLR